jgi:hypothetical protein
VPNVVTAILKNRECWTRFLSLHGGSTCLAPPEGGGNGFSKVLLCRSVAELCGAHSLFRCVPIIRRDRWPSGLVTSICNFSQYRLNDIGLTPGQHKRRLRNGLRAFNGAIPATTDRKSVPGNYNLAAATKSVICRQRLGCRRSRQPRLFAARTNRSFESASLGS